MTTQAHQTVPATDRQVGRAVPRVEDRALLTGTATFLDDVPTPEPALHVAYVRSTVAHGILTGLDAEYARAVPGVVAVFTHEDLADVKDVVTPVNTAEEPPRPLLPRHRVRFVGEPVAVVVAESRYVAEDAAGMVEVRIDPLPAVASVEQALAPDAPVLFEEAGISSNVLFERTVDAGDVDTAFAQAAHVVEFSVRHPRLSPAPMECRGAAAYEDTEGTMHAFVSTQAPNAIRDLAAEIFDLDVRVQCPDIGGGFGLKAVVVPEEMLVIWAAKRLGRPVKWVEDRTEALLASGHARDFRVDVRAAVDADGTMTALEIDSHGNMGAYALYPVSHVLETQGVVSISPGPYQWQNYRACGRAVATNTCPSGPYRGVGLPIATLVHERAVEELALASGISGLELRRRNLVRPEMMPYTSPTGQEYDSGDYLATLEAAVAMIDVEAFAEKQAAARAEGRLIGLGFSSYVEWTGSTPKLFQSRGMTAMRGWDSCRIEVTEAGKVQIWTSAPAIGQGTATTYAQVFADASGVEFDDIEVRRADTEPGQLTGTGTGSARSAGVMSGALVGAGEKLRALLVADAADLLDAVVGDVDFRGGLFSVRGEPGAFVSLGDLAAAVPEGRYDITEVYSPEHVQFSYATHACTIEVDCDTGLVQVLDYVVAEDCGTVINPIIVDGQTKGGIAQGIAAALYENLEYDTEGQPLAASFMDYLMPTASETFPARVTHLPVPGPRSVLGAKGAGEGGTIAAAVCVANAVSDAVQDSCAELPIHPEVLLGKAKAHLARLSS